jgi:hypothetical protein
MSRQASGAIRFPERDAPRNTQLSECRGPRVGGIALHGVSKRLVKVPINTTPRHVKNPGMKRRINDWFKKYNQQSDKDTV